MTIDGRGRNRAFRRTLTIARLIAGPTWRTIDELATLTRSHARTVRRSIEALGDVGVPVQRRTREDSTQLEYHVDRDAWAALLE